MEERGEKEYLEDEKFLAISFELPVIYNEDKLAREIFEHFAYTVNLRIVRGKIVKEPEAFIKSKKTNGILVRNTKHVKQNW